MKRTGIVLVAAVVLLGSGQQGFAAVYSAYIASTSPVGWWGMNETGAPASTADLSGAYGAANNQAGVNLPATYQGVGTGTLPDQAGFVTGAGNRAAYVDGSTDSGAYAHGAVPYDLNVVGAIYRYDTGFSLEVWAKTDGILSVDSERFIATREFGLGFEAGYGNPNRVHFTTFGKQDYFSTTPFPNDGKWHQIGLSWDGVTGTADFFIDGVAAGSQAGAAGLRAALSPGANTLNLTHRNTDTQHFKGWLDEAVIWDHTRTAADFADSYAAGIPEPATMSLLALGGLGVLLRRRRTA